MCLCLGCGGVGGGLRQGMEGWCYVCVRCESGFSVWMAGPGICVLCLADTCTSEVYPVFNPVAPYQYLLPTMYLFMADITNSDLFVCGCRTWICLDITWFYEEQGPSSSASAWSACKKMVNVDPSFWGRMF